MARSQFTFKFPNAQPGAPVTFSAAVYSSPVDAVADGPTLALDSQRTVAVWTDATELTATWVDGAGASITAEASLAYPVVTATGGVPGTPPTAASGASAVTSQTPLASIFKGAAALTAGTRTQIVFPSDGITMGADFWGVPDSALNLAVTLSMDGKTILYPVVDAMFDIQVEVTLTGTPSAIPAGTVFGVTINGWQGALSGAGVAGAITTVGGVAMRDKTFVGDTGAGFGVTIDLAACATDVTANVAVIVTQA